MGICKWFKRITGRKRKDNTPIKLEIQNNSNKSGVGATSRQVTGHIVGTKESAATRIQTAFRAYKARKTLRYLNGISRFKAHISVDDITKQASTALERLHFLSKVQAEISARRIDQMKLQPQFKVESKLHKLEIGWCTGPDTIKETMPKIQQRREAANKRERSLAYAFSHQWRANSNRCFGEAYYDLSKETWGWDWMERWIAVYKYEARVVVRPVFSPRPGLIKKSYKRTTNMVNGEVQEKQAIVLPEQHV